MQRPDVRSTNKDRPTHPVDGLERGHHLIAHVRNTGVDGCGLRLDCGASCIHDLPPFMWGSVSTAPPDHFIVLSRARRGNGSAAVSLMAIADSLKPAAHPNNTCFAIKRN